MSVDAFRRPHVSTAIVSVVALTTIAAAVMACMPPRDSAPATPKSTIATIVVFLSPSPRSS
jgi:hypothetical protein